MIFIKLFFLVFIGLCCGFAVAGGVFAFVTMLGIIPRMASRLKVAKHLVSYENAIILGATIGNAWYLSGGVLPVGRIFLCLFGTFAGVYIGCLAMALAEVLRVQPIIINRFQLKEGLPFILMSIAFGKMAGVLLQFLAFR